jgi:hypothetical protein
MINEFLNSTYPCLESASVKELKTVARVLGIIILSKPVLIMDDTIDVKTITLFSS